MNKILLFGFSLVLFFAAPLEAQWVFWGQKYCWGCRRYMDPTYANYDAIPYGYVDNINYPDPYALPRNCFFNYCPPCRYGSYNQRYFLNSLQYSRQK